MQQQCFGESGARAGAGELVEQKYDFGEHLNFLESRLDLARGFENTNGFEN